MRVASGHESEADIQNVRRRLRQVAHPGIPDVARVFSGRILEGDAGERWMAGQSGPAIGSKAFGSKSTPHDGRLRPRTGRAAAKRGDAHL